MYDGATVTSPRKYNNFLEFKETLEKRPKTKKVRETLELLRLS